MLFVRRKVFAFTAATLATAGLSACSSANSQSADTDCTPAWEFETVSPGALTVFGPDYPPLFTFDGSAMSGVDGEILTGFAEAACLEPSVTVVPAASVIEGVRGGQADVAAGGWYPTPERAEVVGQTAPVYADPVVIVGIDPSADLADYAGEAVGTTQGYLWTEDMIAWGGDDVKLYQSPDAVFQDLLNGRLDAALMAVNEASYRLEQNPGSGLSYVLADPVDFVEATVNPAVTDFPYTKENAALGDALDDYIAQIRGTGELADLLESYGIDPSSATPEG